MAKQITVFNPAASYGASTENRRPVSLATNLSGKIIGFIDNSKTNFDHLVDDLAEVMMTVAGAREVIKYRKQVASMPAPDSVMEDAVKRCDLVITGSGD